jgi:hypothetical protein
MDCEPNPTKEAAVQVGAPGVPCRRCEVYAEQVRILQTQAEIDNGLLEVMEDSNKKDRALLGMLDEQREEIKLLEKDVEQEKEHARAILEQFRRLQREYEGVLAIIAAKVAARHRRV